MGTATGTDAGIRLRFRFTGGRIGFDRMLGSESGVSWLVSGPRKKLTTNFTCRERSRTRCVRKRSGDFRILSGEPEVACHPDSSLAMPSTQATKTRSRLVVGGPCRFGPHGNEMQTTDYTRRSSHGHIAGRGFDSRRLHLRPCRNPSQTRQGPPVATSGPCSFRTRIAGFATIGVARVGQIA